MRFKIGLAIGFAAGYWLGIQADEERKRQVVEAVDKVRDNPRVQRVSSSVSHSASRITNAVEDRIIEKADTVADAAGQRVAPDGSPSDIGTSPRPGTGTG